MRCRLDVDLKAVLDNYASAKGMLAGNAQIIPVLKADAYGLGAAFVGRALYSAGARFFAVATYEEAAELKTVLPQADVLAMGWMDSAQMEDAIDLGIMLTAFSKKSAEDIQAAAMRAGKTAGVHIKLDTGLHRIGFDPEDIAMADGLSAQGMFTHLALHDSESDQKQLSEMERAAKKEWFLHGLDSIGMTRYPTAHMDGVRVGAWLYGVCPKGYPNPSECLPVARFSARIAQIRHVEAGERIGYDDEHPLAKDSVVATVTAGYGDGYPRLHNTGSVEIMGRRAPLLGLVCMDYLMADITGIEGVSEGDEAVLLGGSITIDEYAGFGNMNRNEALVRISSRVPRIYRGNFV